MSFKANVKLGSLPVQVDADSIKELFQQVSMFAETPCECGKCGSKELAPRHRNVEENDFYELFCQECRATFPFGAHKKADTLFANNTKGWQDPYRKAQD